MSQKRIDIEKLIASYSEIGTHNPEIMDDMLKEQGYNPVELEQRGLQKIRKLIFVHEVARKKANLLDSYQRALQLVHVAATDTKEVILNVLRQKSPAFQFRNLDKLDEENLRQILNETEVLELIEKLTASESK